jgi:hypothetical protein
MPQFTWAPVFADSRGDADLPESAPDMERVEHSADGRGKCQAVVLPEGTG